MVCQECGAKTEKNIKFCPECGRKLKHKGRLPLIIAIVEGVVIVLLFGIIMILGSSIVELESTVAEYQASDQAEDAAKAIVGEFDVLNIELTEVDKTSYEKEIISTYRITNKGDSTIKYYTIKYAYYDANDNLVCTDERYVDVLLDPGKSADMKTYSKVDGAKDKIASIKPVSYTYKTTDNKDRSVNLQTKEYTIK